MKKLYVIALFTMSSIGSALAMSVNIKELALNQKTLNQQLIIATKRGDLESMQFLIAKGASIDVKDTQGDCLLDFVTENEDAEAMEFLINVSDPYGWTLLHFAVACSDIREIQFLIDNGAEINVKNEHDKLPLHFAVENGDIQAMQLLIEKGSLVDDKDNQGDAPLHYATWNNNIDAMRLLIKNKANINIQDETGDTPLHCAVANLNMGAIELLVENRANVNVQNNKCNTPLHYAANKGSVRIMRYLLEHGARFDMRDKLEECPLLLFDGKGDNIEAIKLFIENGVDITIESPMNYTPLHYAASENDKETMKFFINNGAKVDVRDEYNSTPLHYAARNGHAKIVKLLMASPIILNNGLESLMAALVNFVSNESIKKYALQCYLDPEAKQSKVFFNELYKQHILKLRQYIAMKDTYGKTALEYAKHCNQEKIIFYLNEINNLKKYSDLDEEIKKLTEESYKKQLALQIIG